MSLPRAWWIAGGFFVLWLATILAGSDIPPPRGFVWVVGGLVVICIGMALAIPWLWGVGRRHGLPAVLVRTSGIGFVVGPVLTRCSVRASRVSPRQDAADYAIRISVVMVVGALNGVVVGLVTSWLHPAS